VRATTDAGGRLSFALTERDVPLSAEPPAAKLGTDPRPAGHIVVRADGFTMGLS